MVEEMVINTKQKQLLEKQLKSINISYGIGFGLGFAVSLLVNLLIFKPLSDVPLMGIEEYLTGYWSWAWTFLILLLVFFNWIRMNKLTERKKEIQMRLAEKVVD
jgi:hypothetical protein